MPRGGKRENSGRKPSTIKGITKRLSKFDAELLLAKINANQKWKELADSKDPRVVLAVLTYLTDRAYGKPRQHNEITGKDDVPLNPPSIIVNLVRAPARDANGRVIGAQPQKQLSAAKEGKTAVSELQKETSSGDVEEAPVGAPQIYEAS